MTNIDLQRDELEARVLALGREGLGRGEIVGRLGMTAAEARALEGARPGFARAMDAAEAEARAWWEAAARQAMQAGVRFNHAGWLAAMRWRFGDGPAADAARSAAARSQDEAAPARPRAIVDLPDNGRERGISPAGARAEAKSLKGEIALLEGTLGRKRARLQKVTAVVDGAVTSRGDLR
jgi:hypothetical protein